MLVLHNFRLMSVVSSPLGEMLACNPHPPPYDLRLLCLSLVQVHPVLMNTLGCMTLCPVSTVSEDGQGGMGRKLGLICTRYRSYKIKQKYVLEAP